MKAMLGLCAAGTLPRDEAIVLPGFARRVRLVFEIALFFVGAPLLVSYALHQLRLPLFYALPPILVGFFIYLLWDPTFLLRRELARGFSLGSLAASRHVPCTGRRHHLLRTFSSPTASCRSRVGL